MLLLFNLLLALAWMALIGKFGEANFVVGFVLGYATLWVGQRAMGASSYFVKVRQVISFAGFFLWELLLANLRVAYDIVTPGYFMRPGVIAIPLDVKSDAEITLLANLITLTPGTLSLDVSTDRRTLYIHAVYVKDLEKFRQSIKDGFERRVQEVFR
jgi:multicomponent Na+:H+ antiporter subunit E